MPQTEVYFYLEDDGSVPVLEWLDELRREDPRAWAKCRARINRLRTFGHELRRPVADLLRDRIYELRAKHGRVNYRILYFFHGQHVAVLAHGLTKEKAVPDADIERALRRKQLLEASPETHIYKEERHG